eukprot:9806478-Alexandrium_andersonii.AAC.1
MTLWAAGARSRVSAIAVRPSAWRASERRSVPRLQQQSEPAAASAPPGQSGLEVALGHQSVEQVGP